MPNKYTDPNYQAPKSDGKAGKLIAKAPALEQLSSQLAVKGEAMTNEARLIVREAMDATRRNVRVAVSEELQAIADDSDFFGFGDMFESPVEELPPIEAIDVEIHQ